ncbi:MAG: hypothetical protein COC01_09410 [Bacteroidetes bacterium]|nr:MAG: hypothetical protein COC01_09410 [Bacteroidota bacterium]
MRFTAFNNNISSLAFITVISFAIASCTGGEESKETAEDFKIDSAAASALQVGNVVFCIPSPIQTAVLIKDVGANYSKEMLNSTKNINSYSTNYLKSLNLGIYGADLGYSTIYEQPQDGIKYLKAVEGLADDIGVSGAFSIETMKRITDNLGNQDSLLTMVADCYRSANAFLQNNDRDDACSLILAGGWIESLYFVTQIAGSMTNQEIINRIGEQKSTLNNLIKLIEPHYNQPEFRELLDQLIDLAYEFDEVEVKYTFVQPTVDVDKQLSIINSTSEVIITAEQIKNISEKIKLIREQIVG